jgi:hypothetical protein
VQFGGSWDNIECKSLVVTRSELAFFDTWFLKVQSHQILYFILKSINLNQYFVRRLWFLNFFISYFFIYLNKHFKTASMRTLTNYAEPY